MNSRCVRLAAVVLASLIVSPALARAQAVGVVTALTGEARLTRATGQKALRFRDRLVLRDIIDTRERSLARILFGRKSTVTVRELSRLAVREEILPTGAARAVHELFSGAILVNVVQGLLRPGEEVRISTPNAVAVVRGTTIFAQYIVESLRTVLICITGSCIVIPRGAPPITLTANGSVVVAGDPARGLQVTEGTITQAQAQAILRESEIGPAVTEEADQARTREAATRQAAELATGVVEALTGAAAAVEETRVELQPKAIPPPKPTPGGDPLRNAE